MAGKAINYFENSRRAIYAQQAYAMRNPKKYKGYGRFSWGITASDGPGPAIRRINGRRIRFYSYIARSFPYGPDDGTLAPWAVAASLPFAPEVVLPSLHRLNEEYPEITNQYGFKCSYNPTFTSGNGKCWVSKGYYRSGPGADHHDDRKLPHGFDLALDASLCPTSSTASAAPDSAAAGW